MTARLRERLWRQIKRDGGITTVHGTSEHQTLESLDADLMVKPCGYGPDTTIWKITKVGSAL